MDNVIHLYKENEPKRMAEEKERVKTKYRIIEFVPIDYKKEMALYCSIGLNLRFALGYLLII